MATNIAKENTLYFSKMKSKKILKSLIKSGSEILSMYQGYDPKISKFEIRDVEPDFFQKNIEVRANMNPVIFCAQKNLDGKKYTQARVYEPIQGFSSYSFGIPFEYKEISLYTDQKSVDELKREMLTGLSKQGISVFNVNEHKKWENRCLAKLGAIGYGTKDFFRATGNPNPYDNYDVHFIKRFERQMACLRDILENISDSSYCRNFVKNKGAKVLRWVVRFIVENPLKFCVGIAGTVISALITSYLGGH